MTYALLIYSGPEAIPEDEYEQLLGEHRSLQTDTIARSELLAVARLEEGDTARTVRRSGDAHLVVDGPFAETKELLVGFYLIDCEDEATALEHAKRICPFGKHAIEVRPVRWKWDGPDS